MGMDEEWADCENHEKHPWRKELEVFAGYVDPDAPKERIPIGARVILRRGGHEVPAPGQLRDVKATYIDSDDHQVQCRLEQDDPDACASYCTKKGDVGWWTRSIMRLDPEHMP